jgi:uncharacterized coiled-coil protein SlyX
MTAPESQSMLQDRLLALNSTIALTESKIATKQDEMDVLTEALAEYNATKVDIQAALADLA